MWPCTPNREWKKYMMGAIEYIMWHRIYIIDSQQGLLKYVHRNHASWSGWLHRCWARWGPLWLRGGGIEKRNKFDLISCHEFYLASTVGFCWKLLGVPFRANRLKKKTFCCLAMANLYGVAKHWWMEPSIQERVKEGGIGAIVVTNNTQPLASKDVRHALWNREVLIPIMENMRYHHLIKTPDMGTIQDQVWNIHLLSTKQGFDAHNLPPIPEELEVPVHLSVISIKKLVSYVRAKYIRPHMPRDKGSFLHACFHFFMWLSIMQFKSDHNFQVSPGTTVCIFFHSNLHMMDGRNPAPAPLRAHV